jgi:spore coat protein U-like protein
MTGPRRATNLLRPPRDGRRVPLHRKAAGVWRLRRWMALAGVSVLGTLALGLPAIAATATGSVAVSATVTATCQITTTALTFPAYVGVQLDGTATVSVTCTNTTPYSVGLSAGAGTGATVTARKMTGAVGVFLNYALFSDAGRTVNWGATVGTDIPALGPGNGAAQVATIYGRVAAGQFIAPAAYTDTITATVTY